MKSIVVFIATLGGGGAENVCKNVVNYFSKKGISITLVVNNLNDNQYYNEIDSEVEIYDLKANSMRELPLKLVRFLNERKFDVALVFSYEISIILNLIKKICFKEFIIISRCINTISYERKYEKKIFRKYITHSLIKIFYKKCDLVIAQSSGMKDDLIKNYNFNTNKIRIINNPLATKYEYEICSDTIYNRGDYIVYIGRLENQKGIEMLIDAYANIRSKYDIKLKLIGSGSLKGLLLEKVDKMNLNDRIEFIDFSKDTITYLKNARLTVLSSYFEGFPNVLIESLACGTPIVSFDCPSGPSEIIINNDNGYLVNYLDRDDLTRKIDKALETKWDYDKIKYTAKRYTSNIIMEEYLSVIFD